MNTNLNMNQLQRQMAELRDEAATLRTLLDVQERIALAQTQKLERAMEEQARVEAEQLRLRDEVIAMQEKLLMELSTPLMVMSAGVVLMPLVGTVDVRRAQRMLDTLLSGIQAWRARIAILDVTGVPTMDQEAATILLNATAAARLLGTTTVLTGIRPEVATQLIDLGVDITNFTTFANLQAAMAWATRTRR